MARYKWDSPQDWLGDKINAALHAAQLGPVSVAQDAAIADLANIANTIVNGTLAVDSDAIQDAFQDEMDEAGYFQDMDICNKLSREACVELLEGVSIDCSDDEDTATLRTAVESNLEDGTLNYSEIEALVA